ncbi:protein DpdG [Magnetococcales bacterium HHB-1]
MTILNTASDGFFNVLIVLHRTLARHGPMKRDRLIALCALGADGDTQRLNETLVRWTQLGLFKVSKEVIYALDDADKKTEHLPAICRRLLFSDENNQNFWDNKGTLAADFTRALAFILAQDIYKEAFDSHSKVQALELRQIKDTERRVLQNDVRWNGLRFWGDFLGFFWNDQRRWPDPTMSIRDELPGIFSDRSELPAEDFIVQLSECIPVLDGGRYRQQVEEVLDAAEWQSLTRETLLSTSLSRALWRLSRPGGPLQLEQRADAGSGLTLQRSQGREWLTFTHAYPKRSL